MSFDDPQSRPLADDPDFLDSLADLDQGLADGDLRPSAGATPRGVRPPPAAKSADLPSPEQARPEALPPLGVPLVTTPGKRPLLDIFPSNSAAPPTHHREADLVMRAPVEREPPADRRRAERTTDVLPYEAFYGLHDRPFTLAADPRFLYHSAEHDRVAQQMLSAIGRREALVALTGETGVGKTTLCRALVEELDRRMLTSIVADPIRSKAELLKTLLIDFGVVAREEFARGRLSHASPDELSRTLSDFLTTLMPLQAFAVVIIDEAQQLPVQVLNDLCVLANTTDDDLLMQIVLVGQASVLSALKRPELKRYESRLTLKCTLGPLAEDEVGDYVKHRLRVAGDKPRVEFDRDAVSALYSVSQGSPRVVNLVCDRALAIGFDRVASVIDRPIVDAAAADLDLAARPERSRSTSRAAVPALLLVMLIFVGAVGAAFTFRADVSAIVMQWVRVPAPPAVPHLSIPKPYVPPDPAALPEPGNPPEPDR